MEDLLGYTKRLSAHLEQISYMVRHSIGVGVTVECMAYKVPECGIPYCGTYWKPAQLGYSTGEGLNVAPNVEAFLAFPEITGTIPEVATKGWSAGQELQTTPAVDDYPITPAETGSGVTGDLPVTSTKGYTANMPLYSETRVEVDHLPAPILYTTNCLMPPKSSYADRVFTTEMVAFPGAVHIDEKKDFTPVIEKALELGGYKEDQILTGINGGKKVTTGFGHAAILSHAGTVVEAVKSGAIRHFFLVAGCDGAKPGRNYYTEFVKQTPSDSIVLTLACGKFRFNDLELGEIGGLPRLMDMGQCNDAYGAIQVAVALADAFGCSVNELPLSFVLSWYEQKAVCILLTLLHLGIKNIRLGPSLPAFLSPNILNFLVENYGIAPITTPEEDIKALMNHSK